MAYIRTMDNQIHVLLVDDDEQTRQHKTNLLQMKHYTVTPADAVHVDIQMLLKNEEMKFDVVMAAINPHDDLSGYRLIQRALNIFIPVVWMSDDDSMSTAMRALKNGAFLCINKRDLSMEFVECLWQHVIRERVKLLNERAMLDATKNLGPTRGIEFKEEDHQPDPNPNPN